MKALSLTLSLALAFSPATGIAIPAHAEVDAAVDAALPTYQPAPVEMPKSRYVLPDGTIRLYGAVKAKAVVERLNNLFDQTHPGVRFDTSRMKGSNSGIAALTHDVTAFAALDRPYGAEDATSYEKIVGAPPIELQASAFARNDSATGNPAVGAPAKAPLPLYFCVRHQKGVVLAPFIKAYFQLVFSKQGQQIIAESGYLALSASEAAQQLAKLN